MAPNEGQALSGLICCLIIWCSVSGYEAMLTSLRCNPGDRRVYTYESETKLWGPIDQNVNVDAEVSVHCLGNVETDTNETATKYLVQVIKIDQHIARETDATFKSMSNRLDYNRKLRIENEWLFRAWESLLTLLASVFKPSSGDLSPQIDCKGIRPGFYSQLFEGQATKGPKVPEPGVYDDMYSLPFEFIQQKDGSVSEVKFSPKEILNSVKNFKKHIADAFASQLDPKKETVVEKSPIGEHTSKYGHSSDGSNLLKTTDTQFLRSNRPSPVKRPSREFTVFRVISEENVIKLGDGEETGLNPNGVAVNAVQTQRILRGKITTTEGQLSLRLFKKDANSERRVKRRSTEAIFDESEDIITATTHYHLNLLPRKMKRATDLADNLQKLKSIEARTNFVGESIVASSKPEVSGRDRLASSRVKSFHFLKSKFGPFQWMTSIIVGSQTEADKDGLSLLMETLNSEYLLDEDQIASSLSAALRGSVPLDVIHKLCQFNGKLFLDKCHPILVLLLKAGDEETADDLMHSFEKSHRSEDKANILHMLTHINRPSDKMVLKLIETFHEESNEIIKSNLLMTATTLTNQPNISPSTSSYVVKVIGQQLNLIKCEDKSGTSVDVLESIGNLNERRLIPAIISVATKCPTLSYKIAAIHGLRQLVAEPAIVRWFYSLVSDTHVECLVKREVVITLTESISAFNKFSLATKVTKSWPKYGFNELDEYLLRRQLSVVCLEEYIIKYFETKVTPKWVEPIRPRTRRSVLNQFWDSSECIDTFGNKEVNDGQETDHLGYSEESAKNGLEREAIPRKRKHCTAKKTFGLNVAQASVQSDIITQEVESAEYALMAQFLVGTQFMGNNLPIGKMYIYNSLNKSRAYVHFMGRTFLDSNDHICDSALGVPYKYATGYPLYDFYGWGLHLTMTLRVFGEMALNPVQETCSYASAFHEKRVNLFSPNFTMRGVAEASAQIMMFKGGIDIGGDFNFNSDLHFSPDPEMCFTAFAGHKPMHVGVESWSQFWDFNCKQWMERTVWRPKSFNWFSGSKRNLWIDNQCLFSERGLDTTPSVATIV